MDNVESLELTLNLIRQTCKEVVNPTAQKPNSTSSGKEWVIGKCKEVECSFTDALRKKHQESFGRVYKEILWSSLSEKCKEEMTDIIFQKFENSFLSTIETSEDSCGEECFSSDFNENSSELLSSKTPSETKEGFRKKREPLPMKARRFLERVFERKKLLNSKERHAVARCCNLTPLQVRVWFVNKRMRSK